MMKKVPKRRFKGFLNAGDWEQRKLADVANIIMGQSPSSQNYTDNPNDNILVQGNADLIDGQVVPRLWTKEITKSIDAGNIVMTVRAPVGDVAKTAYKVVLGRGVAGIKGDEYIYQFLLKLKYNHYWRSLSSGSTFESINSNDIKNLIIDIPCDEERTKIRNLLSTTDTLITLHQRKLEKLQATKKALLYELFPIENSRRPKRRFKGFTDDWEQRKLGECVDISTGYPFDSQDFNENGEYLVITNGNIQENTPFVLNNVGNRIDLDDSLKKYILDIDDLLITMDGTVGRVAIVVDNKLVLAQRVCRIKSNEPYYIYQLLSKNDFIRSMNKIGHGGTIKHISLSEISEYQAFYPKSQKERIKISSVLTNYDELITLHQRKLEKLKNLKAAYLNEMFV